MCRFISAPSAGKDRIPCCSWIRSVSRSQCVNKTTITYTFHSQFSEIVSQLCTVVLLFLLFLTTNFNLGIWENKLVTFHCHSSCHILSIILYFAKLYSLYFSESIKIYHRKYICVPLNPSAMSNNLQFK